MQRTINYLCGAAAIALIPVIIAAVVAIVALALES
jgi:hypothetical protein